MMKRVAIIIVVLLAAGAGLFCLKAHKAECEYRMGGNYLEVSGGDFEIVFKPGREWTGGGFLRSADYVADGPFALFSGSYGLVWGDTAVELAWHNSNDVPSGRLSDQAREAVAGYASPAAYIDDHTISFFAVAVDSRIDAALKALAAGDLVTLKGFEAEIISARYQGEPIAVDLQRVICISAVTNNGNLGR